MQLAIQFVHQAGVYAAVTDPLASYNYCVSVADLQTSGELETFVSPMMIRNEGIRICMIVNIHACAYSIHVC